MNISLLLLRREKKAQETNFIETWDYEWDYTMGKLEEQEGWGVDKSGTGSTSMITNGEKFITSSNSYYQIYPVSAGIHGNLRQFDNGYGILEAVVYGVFNSGSPNLRITAKKSATERVTLLQHAGKWKVWDATNATNCTVLTDAVNNVEYTARIVFKNTVADIYINGVLVLADYDVTKTKYGGSNGPMHQNGGNNYYGVLKSLKIKLGSIN